MGEDASEKETLISAPDEDHTRSAWQVLGPVIDLATPMAVRVAATLRLADLITEGVTRLPELADRSGSDRDALGRMLRHLVSRGVFAEPEPDRFALAEASSLLLSDDPSGMRLWLDLDEFGGRMDLAFTGLLHTVRTGEPAWEQVFGSPFWQYLDADRALSASFDATMAVGPEYAAAAVGGLELTSARQLVDVGGGTGVLVTEALRRHPTLRTTLVDLPGTVARGRAQLAASGLESRCDFVGQSFFDPLPKGGDVYVLNQVLHDWGDEEARAILHRCAEAIGDRGRLVVVEAHGTSGDDPATFAEMNLRMLVLCGGRERSLDEYVALAGEADLRVTHTRRSPLGHALIECKRSGQVRREEQS